jgi:hypothetical protein
MSHRYPLAIFFALAYVISWLLWAPLWLPAFGVDGLPTLPFHHALGALGPIAAAFLVSAAETGVAGPADLLLAYHRNVRPEQVSGIPRHNKGS